MSEKRYFFHVSTSGSNLCALLPTSLSKSSHSTTATCNIERMIGFGKIHDVSKQSGAKSGAFVVDVCLKVGPEVTLMGCLSNNSMFHLKAVHNSQITTLSLTFTSDQNNQAHKVYILQLNPLKIAFLQKSGVLFVLNLSAYFVNNKLPGNLQSLMLTTTGAIAYNSTSTLNLEQTLKTATAIVNIKQYNYVFPTHITPLPSQSNIISDDSYILCSYSDGTISVWNTNNSKNESSILYDFINTNQLTTNTDTSGLIRSSTSDSSLNTSMTSNPNHNNSVLSMLLQNAISCGQKLLVVTLQEHTIVQQTKPFITSSNNSNSHSHYVLTLHSDINDNLSNNTTRYDHTNNSNHNSHQPSSQFVQRTSITSHVNTLEMLHYISNSATDSVSSSGQLLSNVVGIYDVTVLNKLHTYYQSLNTIITTSDSTPNTECHKTFELMISVDLMNSLLLFYSLPIAPPIVVPPPSSTLTTINTSNKSNKTPSLPLNKPPPPATNKPSLIKSPSVTELITLYETGRVTSSHTTAVTEGVTLPQTKLGSGSGGGDVKSLSVDTNNSDTNNNNKNKDYIQLAPFASIDLFTILHPHTTTDNYSAADNTNKPPPQYQHITHVSVLDHSILIFSSEVSCVSHSVSGLVNKITIVRIGKNSTTVQSHYFSLYFY